MPDLPDAQLVTRLLDATKQGRIQWEKTAIDDQFVASYAGKWLLRVDRGTRPSIRDLYWLTLANSEGDEILKLYSTDFPPVTDLFETARRNALKVDQAIADLLKELDEDIPF
jgi:hypothetical protein